MKQKSAWEGDWQARVSERVKAKGYETLISFAERNPKATFFELAKMLGEQVAPIQVQQLLCEAYDKQNQYPRYLQSSLAREIKHAMPEGWGVGNNFDLKGADAFINWKENMPDQYNDFTQKVWAVLKNADVPKGWLPSGADDPIIVNAFQKAGFKELKITLT